MVIVEQEIWTVLSNLTFLIPGVCFFICKLYTESFALFSVTIWSSLYHLCYNMEQCIADPNVLQIMDFYSSYYVIICVVVYFMDIRPRKYKLILHFLLSIILIFTISIDRFDVWSNIVSIILVLPAAIIYNIIYIVKYILDKNSERIHTGRENSRCCKFLSWIYTCYFGRRKSAFHPGDIIFTIIGIVFFTAGFICQYYSYIKYWVLHSIWHTLDAISLIFLFLIHRRKTLFTCCKRNQPILPS